MADDNVHLYHGSKQIVRPNNKVLSVNYSGEVTLDGITYSTYKLKTREYYGSIEGACHDYRQEWMNEGLSIPLSSLGLSGQDIDLSQLSADDLRCKYTRNSDNSLKRQSMGTGRSASWWTDTFAPDVTDDSNYSLNARSILTTDGKRLYNDAAVTLIDEHYKSLGWRVPDLDDCINASRYYGTEERGLFGGIGNEHADFPSPAVFGRIFDSQYPDITVYPYVSFFNPHTFPWSTLRNTATVSENSGDSVVTCSVKNLADPTANNIWNENEYPWTIPNYGHQDYPSGTYGIIRLGSISSMLVTRCVANIDGLGGQPLANIRVPVRIGIRPVLSDGKFFDGSVYPPQVQIGWMDRGIDFPNFYEVRLCRAPIKP